VSCIPRSGVTESQTFYLNFLEQRRKEQSLPFAHIFQIDALQDAVPNPNPAHFLLLFPDARVF
jgi:hypothetical protein